VAVDDDDAIDRGIDDRSQTRIRVVEIRGSRVHSCLQVVVCLPQCVGSLPLPTGVASDEPENPGKESGGCHREGNREELKTAHRRLVHLHAVGQQTVLFGAHRLQRAAGVVHARALGLGIRRVDWTMDLSRLDRRTKRGLHARRVLAKLRHPRLLNRIVDRQRRQPTDVGVERARRVTESLEIPSFGRRHTASYSGVRVHDRREHTLDRSQHALRVNDPFIGGSRSLDGPVDDPHHGQEGDDGQYSRPAKCA